MCITSLKLAIRRCLRSAYSASPTVRMSPSSPHERPPRIEMGEVATPVSLRAGQAPEASSRINDRAGNRHANCPPIEGVRPRGNCGCGIRQSLFFAPRTVPLPARPRWQGREATAPAVAAADAPKRIVEHTNINPNKAAHIGHLRNAALGDTLVRLLRRAGRRVEVQNYIDNTGVQVADVVIGFLHIARKSPADGVPRACRAGEVRLFLLGPLRARDALLRGRQDAACLAR